MKTRPVRKLGAEELYQYGLRVLSGRALSVSELKTRLNRRAEAAGDVDNVISRLRDLGFLNDARLAEGYASARRDSGTVGRARVIRDLRQRRVAPQLAESAVHEAYSGTDEAEMIQNFLERKFRNINLREHLQDEKHLAAAYRKLRYAGFSSGASIRALKGYSERADEIEDSLPEENPEESV